MDAMSCLAPPPTSFFPAAPPAYYTDAAMARALHYSMSDHYSPAASTSSPSSSSSLLADFPGSGGASSGSNWFAPTMPAPQAPTGLTCDSVLVASDAAPRPPSTPATPAATTSTKRRLGLGVAAGAGRAGKRRPRASKRAPTTYITTDPSNFRLMVQHVTGVQAEPGTADDGVLMPASFNASAAAALLNCPTYTGASFPDALLQSGDAATLHHRLQQQQQQQHLEQQQPCFPTLDSWNVLYESAQLF